jgi:GNAT acetyltransferase-like protein
MRAMSASQVWRHSGTGFFRDLGALVQGQGVGFLAHYPTLNWILSLAVHRSLRRQGIGTALLAYLRTEILAQVPSIAIPVSTSTRVCVHPGNAQRFQDGKQSLDGGCARTAGQSRRHPLQIESGCGIRLIPLPALLLVHRTDRHQHDRVMDPFPVLGKWPIRPCALPLRPCSHHHSRRPVPPIALRWHCGDRVHPV